MNGGDPMATPDIIMAVATMTVRVYLRQHPAMRAHYEDLRGDAILGACQASKRWDGTGSERAWLYLRARGALLDGIRQRGDVTRRDFANGIRSSLPVSLDELAANGSEDPGYTRVENREDARRLLARLPERERHVVEQLYYAGRTLLDVGHELGVTESRASQIHQAALKRMRAAA